MPNHDRFRCHFAQAEALRQKDQQLSLVEETEAFLRSALARAEEKIEEDGVFCAQKTPDDVHQVFYRQKSVNLYQD